MKPFAQIFFVFLLVVGFGIIPGCASGGPHPMLGRKAPAFTLPLVEGGSFDLGKHLGKDVVLLDFWASWCPPCREALPKVSVAAAKHADRGVVFCAVNVGESREEAGGYVKRAGLDIPVGLDTDGAVAEAYGVDGIPQTVIIGRNGVIEAVHVGYSSQMGKQLDKELEGLLRAQ